MGLDSLIDEVTRLRGLDTVRVSKADLLSIIRENRAEHRKIFEEAIDGWHEQVQKKLKEMVAAAKKGPQAVQLHLNLPKPEDHTRDYDRVIKMLELSKDEELELDDREFATYVMDDWGWQGAFLATTASYSSIAASKLSSR